MFDRLGRILRAPAHIAPLVTFRIFFGILMMFSTARFMALGWIEDHYTDPVFHFKYYGFEWVEPLSASWLYALHILLFLAALGVTLGLFFRVSALLVFVLFSYFELIDLTYYLNHYYFVSLVSGLLVISPAHRYLSLDVLRKPGLYCNQVPAFSIWIFRFQLALVYLYAGIAKINYAWLIEALPLKIWLPAHDKMPLIGPLFQFETTAYAFSWIGMLYDLTIAFWLMWKPARPWAYISVVIFHVLTGLLFQIGVFPLVMMAATLMFFSDEWHLKWQRRLVGLLDRRQIPFISRKEPVFGTSCAIADPRPRCFLHTLCSRAGDISLAPSAL
jgi:hypothetical protein